MDVDTPEDYERIIKLMNLEAAVLGCGFLFT